MEKINIILFWFMNDWGLYGRTYENIAIGLSNHKSINKVVVILPPNRVAKGKLAFELKNPKSNLFIITPNPRTLNYSGFFYNLRQKINATIPPLSALHLFLKVLGFNKSNTILWLFPHHPFIDKIIKSIPHNLLITQIVDNVLNKNDLDDKTRELVTHQYSTLPKISDITITSSQLNYDFFKKKSSSCYLVENGLDSSFIASKPPLPSLENSERVRLGYLGFISERTNVDLLKYLASERPEYDLIIAGPDEDSRLMSAGLLDFPNVYYIDYVSYQDAPAFIKSLDVCLIPHIHSAFSQSMSPLKLFQYLGSGRPIVSTAVAGTERWNDLIYIADDFDSFTKQVDTALTENSELPAKRINAAKRETWDHRIENLFDIITEHWH